LIQQKQHLIYKNKHNPKELVNILTNFTEDKPMKFTTHIWDFGDLKHSEHKNFEGYINSVDEQWNDFKDELKELSPNLYSKVYNFLWEKDLEIATGWSSLEGLKEWCDEGKSPFEFEDFKDVISSFKKEIEIRKDTMLEDIFIEERKRLNKQYPRKFKVQLLKLKGQTFYTDVEKLRSAIGIIFSQMSEENRLNFHNIRVK